MNANHVMLIERQGLALRLTPTHKYHRCGLRNRQRPDIYAQYVAVYKELQHRRDNASVQAGWNDFVAHARSEIEDDLPWLETHAKPGDREKSLLLYVGRDL